MLDLASKGICPLCSNNLTKGKFIGKNDFSCLNDVVWRNMTYAHFRIKNISKLSNIPKYSGIDIFVDDIYYEYTVGNNCYHPYKYDISYLPICLEDIPFFDFSSEEEFKSKIKMIEVFK